jgi:flavodoxin
LPVWFWQFSLALQKEAKCMKIAVRYYTRTGNVKKLADAIAETAGVEAKSVDTPVDNDVDILFLGSSVYGANIAQQIKEFINSLGKETGKVVNFSTAAMLPGTYKAVRKLVQEKGLVMADDEFHCKGQFKIFHKGHPDKQDIASAKEFARKVLGT